MARASAAVVLAFAVCCLLVAPAPAWRPVDREAAAEKLLPRSVADAEAADQATAIAVPEEGTAIAVQENRPVGEERPQKRSSLLCLVFRCGGDAQPTGAGGVAVARGSSQLDPAVAGTAEVEQGAYESDSDRDSYCDSDDEDSDCDSDDDEGGIVGWFWRLADGF